jgi:hypothetical protein
MVRLHSENEILRPHQAADLLLVLTFLLQCGVSSCTGSLIAHKALQENTEVLDMILLPGN